MRISDWSSDVCSSDLAGGQVDRVQRFDMRFDRSGDSQYAIVDADQDRALERQLRAAQVEPLAAQGADQFRSEEHTSELQSLMRISYAVFCLKKKKRNKEL